MDSAEDILRRVTKFQESAGYSDKQMAEKIGCSRPLYQRTRTGRIPVGGAFIKGALKLLASEAPVGRTTIVSRETGETKISLELDIDGNGKWEIVTGVNIFDHLLSAMVKHGKLDIKLKAAGDDPHHVVEDVAICFGQAFNKTLGEKRGIVRMADATVPMDDSLAMVAVDISGRGYVVLDLSLTGNDMPGLHSDLVRHFLESFAIEARLNLHARVLYGHNDHHKAEAIFKALGRVLNAATRLDPHLAGELPSTKGFLES